MKIFTLVPLATVLLFSNHTINATALKIDNTSNGSDTIPPRQEAQDFNTTRSNRQNSNYIIINIVNNSSEAGDDIKVIGKNPLYGGSGRSGDNPLFEASNKMSTGGKNNSAGKQPNALAPAQDYNSSRSNKSNSVTINVISNPSNSLSWRTLREPPTESYNPWEMEDSNEGTVMNPLYESSGNSGSNPLFEASNKMSTGGKNNSAGKQSNALDPAQDYNSSRSNKRSIVTINVISDPSDSVVLHTLREPPTESYNPWEMEDSNEGTVTINVYNNSSNTKGATPSHQEAQDYNSTRSNKANCLTIDFGGSSGNSKHTGNGFNFNLGYQAPVSGVLKWTAGIGYASWKFKYDPSPLIPEKYLINLDKSIRNQSWNVITINTGPSIQAGRNKLYADLYGKAGVSFIKIPDQIVGGADDLGNVTKETGMARFSGNRTSLSVQTGLRINYAVSRMFDVFVHPYYFSTLGKNISYTEKDVSKAIDDAGNFNTDQFTRLPFEKKEDRIQAIGLSAGIKIRFLSE